MERFFGFLIQNSRTRNPSFLKAARVIANDGFFYLLTFISDSRDAGVTIRRTKDERPEKYSYSSLEVDNSHLLWEYPKFVIKKHLQLAIVQMRESQRRKHEIQIP